MQIVQKIKSTLLIAIFTLLLPIWANAGQGGYTVLAGSYHQLENAATDFNQLRGSVVESLLESLRIEKVGEFYTLRIGDFDTRNEAEDFLPVVRLRFAGARVMEAKIRPERVVKQFGNVVSTENIPSPAEEVFVSASTEQVPVIPSIISPGGRVKKQITKKLPENFYKLAKNTEFFTIQIGSFAKKGLAAIEYDRLLDTLPDEFINWVRIEKVQGFYTVRVGLYAFEDEAKPAQAYLQKKYDKSRMFSAYLKPQRVVRGTMADNLPLAVVNEGATQTADQMEEVVEALSDNIPITEFSEEVLVDDNDQTVDLVDSGQVLQTPEMKDNAEKEKTAVFATKSTRIIYSKKTKQQINDGRQPGFSAIKPPPNAQEFYTLQVSSFSDIALANIEYDNIVQRYPDGVLENLRVEFVKGFFTVRLGKFASRAEVQDLSQILHDAYPRAAILYAYIIPDRIQQQHATAPLLGGADEDGEPLTSPAVSEAAAEIANISAAEERSDTEEEMDDTSQNQIVSIDIIETDEVPTASEIENNTNDYLILNNEEASGNVEAENDPIADVSKMDSESAELPITSVKNSVVLDAGSDFGSNADETDEVVDETSASSAFPSETESKIPEFSYEVVTVLDKDDQGNSIKMPSALFYDYNSDELYMINGVNNRIIVYGPDFFPQNSLGKGRGLDSPLGGFISPSGMVYITQAGSPKTKPRLTILNKAFFPEKEIEMDFVDHPDFIPQKVAVSASGDVFLTGLNARQVLRLNADFTFNKWLDVSIDRRGDYAYSDGSAPVKTALIKDVKVDVKGNIYLLSEETSKIYVFNDKDNFLFSFGVKGGAEGKMSRPRGLAIDEKRRCFFVVDYMRHTVLLYDFTGKFRYEFGGRGWGPEWFNYPVDITLGRNGQVIVADFFNQRTQVFNVQWRDSFPERPPELWGNDL